MDDIYTEILVRVNHVRAQAKKLGQRPPNVKLSFSLDGWRRCIAVEDYSSAVPPTHVPKNVCGYPFKIEVNQPEDFKVITSDGY